MHFLPDVYVTCEVCAGKRYNRDTLEIQYKGKSIAEVLNMTVAEALEFMASVPPIRQKLETLRDVGLDYIHVGQSATTLSGGEAQRIKLAKELSRRATGRTLYILDEPTTGLHFDDIKRLLAVLGRLADTGNTIVVIEHNLDVIKTADYIVDLGPEGGDRGGTVGAKGPPEEVAAGEVLEYRRISTQSSKSSRCRLRELTAKTKKTRRGLGVLVFGVGFFDQVVNQLVVGDARERSEHVRPKLAVGQDVLDAPTAQR